MIEDGDHVVWQANFGNSAPPIGVGSEAPVSSSGSDAAPVVVVETYFKNEGGKPADTVEFAAWAPITASASTAAEVANIADASEESAKLDVSMGAAQQATSRPAVSPRIRGAERGATAPLNDDALLALLTQAWQDQADADAADLGLACSSDSNDGAHRLLDRAFAGLDEHRLAIAVFDFE
jgi:hypothetical protein